MHSSEPNHLISCTANPDSGSRSQPKQTTWKTDLGGSGSAYVFLQTGGTWVQQQKIEAVSASQVTGFGSSVDLSGDYLVAGAEGAAYVFVRSGTIWTQQAELQGGSWFGRSVAIDGDYLVTGDPFADVGAASVAGEAYIFMRTGTNWVQQAILQAATPVAGDLLGSGGWHISGNYVVTGTKYGCTSCEVTVFYRTGTNWVQHTPVQPDTPTAGTLFGRAVAIDGEYLVASATA